MPERSPLKNVAWTSLYNDAECSIYDWALIELDETKYHGVNAIEVLGEAAALLVTEVEESLSAEKVLIATSRGVLTGLATVSRQLMKLDTFVSSQVWSVQLENGSFGRLGPES